MKLDCRQGTDITVSPRKDLDASIRSLDLLQRGIGKILTRIAKKLKIFGTFSALLLGEDAL